MKGHPPGKEKELDESNRVCTCSGVLLRVNVGWSHTSLGANSVYVGTDVTNVAAPRFIAIGPVSTLTARPAC